MGTLLTALITLTVSLSAYAVSEVNWLNTQMRELSADAALIQSYADKKQSYVYDQALALIAFTHAKQFTKARRLAMGLKHTQNADGSWYFSYYLDGTSPHPREGDMRPNGTIAWAALALLTYQKQSHDTSVSETSQKALEHLNRNIVQISSHHTYALRFAQQDNHQTQWDERHVAALEHALDAIAAFRLAYQLSKKAEWQLAQQRLQDFALTLWDGAEGHFWSGLNVKTGKVNRSEFYLDNQSWSALALSHLPIADKLHSALQASCKLMIKADGKTGFGASRSPSSQDEFIWSEGTAGKALALELHKTQCANTPAASYLATLEKMSLNGGVHYVDRPHIPDFAHSPSVAGTVWTWFLRHKINPLDV